MLTRVARPGLPALGSRSRVPGPGGISRRVPVPHRQGEAAGLRAALTAHAETAARRAGAHAEVDIEDAALTAGQEQLVFSIARELLANAARHSQARTIRLCLTSSAEAIELVGSDDGRGFSPGQRAAAVGRGHIGLAAAPSVPPPAAARSRSHPRPAPARPSRCGFRQRGSPIGPPQLVRSECRPADGATRGVRDRRSIPSTPGPRTETPCSFLRLRHQAQAPRRADLPTLSQHRRGRASRATTTSRCSSSGSSVGTPSSSRLPRPRAGLVIRIREKIARPAAAGPHDAFAELVAGRSASCPRVAPGNPRRSGLPCCSRGPRAASGNARGRPRGR